MTDLPDEAVEAAAIVMCANGRQESIWAILDESERDDFRNDARAALTAAAPLIVAQATGDVRALHRPVEIEPSSTICGECSHRMPNGRYMPVAEYPCPTRAALDALHAGGE